MMSIGRFTRQFKPLCLRCRFTLALHVPLPDAAAREDILKAHLERHCRLHALGDDAVDHSLLQVRVSSPFACMYLLGMA